MRQIDLQAAVSTKKIKRFFTTKDTIPLASFKSFSVASGTTNTKEENLNGFPFVTLVSFVFKL
jgi:hypothetical protein